MHAHGVLGLFSVVFLISSKVSKQGETSTKGFNTVLCTVWLVRMILQTRWTSSNLHCHPYIVPIAWPSLFWQFYCFYFAWIRCKYLLIIQVFVPKRKLVTIVITLFLIHAVFLTILDREESEPEPNKLLNPVQHLQNVKSILRETDKCNSSSSADLNPRKDSLCTEVQTGTTKNRGSCTWVSTTMPQTGLEIALSPLMQKMT